MDMWFSHLLGLAAQCQQGQTGDKPPGPEGMLLMILTIGMLAYFMLIRPQKQEQRKREQMLSQLGKGDEIVTAGGIHGTVESVDTAKGTVTVAVAPKISLKFSRSAITTVLKKKGKSGEGAAEAGETK